MLKMVEGDVMEVIGIDDHVIKEDLVHHVVIEV